MVSSSPELASSALAEAYAAEGIYAWLNALGVHIAGDFIKSYTHPGVSGQIHSRGTPSV